MDIAVWIVEKRSKRRWIAIFHRDNKKPFLLEMPPFIDMWTLIPKDHVLETYWEDKRKVVQFELQGEALQVMKSDSHHWVVYWDGSTYIMASNTSILLPPRASARR